MKANQNFYLGINNVEKHSKELIRIGFSKDLNIGKKLLLIEIGKYSSINAEGYNITRKDLPKETHYRQTEWTWKQWAGRGKTNKQNCIMAKNKSTENSSRFIIFKTEDEKISVDVRLNEQDIWLTQDQLAMLYGVEN